MSSSNSDTSISFTKLGENNYTSWLPNMKAFLQSRKVWMVVSGKISLPAVDADSYMEFLEKQESAAGLIFLGLEESQKTAVLEHQDDPKAMWDALEAIHLQKRSSTRFVAYNTLFSIAKEEGESLPALVARGEKALLEIKQVTPKDFTIDQLYDDLISMAMIRSLPAEYESLRTPLFPFFPNLISRL
jgi:hypothetical protein